jgi:hypothetical protein
VGASVGELAREQFPGGVLVDLDPRDPMREPRTRELIAAGVPAIFEATFIADHTYATIGPHCGSPRTCPFQDRWIGKSTAHCLVVQMVRPVTRECGQLVSNVAATSARLSARERLWHTPAALRRRSTIPSLPDQWRRWPNEAGVSRGSGAAVSRRG